MGSVDGEPAAQVDSVVDRLTTRKTGDTVCATLTRADIGRLPHPLMTGPIEAL